MHKKFIIKTSLILLFLAFAISTVAFLLPSLSQTENVTTESALENITSEIQSEVLQTTYTADDFFVNLIENKADLTYGVAVFELRNPTSSTINVGLNSLNIRMSEQPEASPTQSTEYFILKEVSYSENITDYSTACNPYEVSNETGTSVAENCTSLATGWHWNNYTKEEYVPITSFSLEPQQSARIKIISHWEPKRGLNNREWFPLLKVNNVEYEQTKWAWWNESWTSCKNITLINPKANYPLFINVSYDSDIQADFDDVRFVNTYCDNGGSELSYFRRSKTDSSWATFDVRLDTGVNNSNISVYYQNPSISTTSNENNTWGGNVLHYWGMDEGSGTSARDYIKGGSYNGTFINQTTWNQTWRRGSAVKFDGNGDYVEIGNDADFPANASVRTIELWIRGNSLGTAYFALYGTWSTANAYALFFDQSKPGVNLDFGDVLSPEALFADKDYLYTVVLNGTNSTIYINGSKVVTGDHSPDPNTILRGKAEIGGNRFSAHWFNGLIDEYKIYSSALNSSEIANHYAAMEPTYVISNVSVGTSATKTNGLSAIEQGIRNSLGNDITIYTDQQIYLRNLSNYQQLARFDKVTKYGTQIWAFNYFNDSTPFANMPNITPSFYILELANRSSNNITNAVSTYINQTKVS